MLPPLPSQIVPLSTSSVYFEYSLVVGTKGLTGIDCFHGMYNRSLLVLTTEEWQWDKLNPC